ncbi:hypothetical protein P2H44_14700 [Albimonas sp. CAU 1670]|uniref:hypothetical protein n=1 Tax=Albimonas sp. CAU 1670 TaxID=3032599 RepID=UPI0023DC55CF|nr:hypothetical protein [Albimonas sp. CAU 1670]MDF2233807.1 hypothetical protein [Albimonas sp. CAU 1670]
MNGIDNAPMENVVHILDLERIRHRIFAARTEARCDVFVCIESFSNSRRRHAATGCRSPANMELMAA